MKNLRWTMIKDGHHRADEWEITQEVKGDSLINGSAGWVPGRKDQARWFVWESGRRRPRGYRSLGLAKNAIRQIRQARSSSARTVVR
jgi:hypothetical protein